MEFIFDALGQTLGAVGHDGFGDTFHDAHGVVAGRLVHGLGGGPDLMQDAMGRTTGYVHHQLGGGTMYSDAMGHQVMSVQPGLPGGPDMLHDAMGGFIGAIQHGAAPGMADTLYGANWQPLARSFGIQGLDGF